MRTTLLFLAAFLLACEASPQAAAAPTEIPSVTPEIALSTTSTPITPLDTPTPVSSPSTPVSVPTPEPTLSPETDRFLRQLQDFGAEVWPDVEYTCDVNDFIGACIGYDGQVKTHIFFDINFWNGKAITLVISERNEDWIAGCEYPNFEYLNEPLSLRYPPKCSDRRTEKGKAVKALNTMLSEKWPALVGDRRVPPTPTPHPTRTPFPFLAWTPEPEPTPTPFPLGLQFDHEGYMARLTHDGFTFGEGEVRESTNGHTTIILTGPIEELHSAKIIWDDINLTPQADHDLLMFTLVFDYRLSANGAMTGCVFDAFPDDVPLTARGDNYYATADIESDGRYSLTFTSWEHMPAFEPHDLPITCE